MNQSSSEPEISILIVAYNSVALIEACLNAIGPACARAPYEVLLIDNGDGSTEALVRENYPGVRIVSGRGNIGFAAGNNLLAREARGRFLLLANPDLEMHAGAIDELLDGAARYPVAAAWGGATLDRNGRPDIGNSVHIPSLGEMASRLFGRSSHRLGGTDDLVHDTRVDALSGGFVMFRRAIWEDAGGLDERYFLYCEEVDLFHRLAIAGHVFWRIGTARAFHDAGHGNAFAAERLLYKAAGTMQFVRLHWTKPRQIAAFFIIWLTAILRFLGGAVLGLASPHFRKVSEGYRQIALHPGYWRFGYDRQKGLLARRGPDCSS